MICQNFPIFGNLAVRQLSRQEEVVLSRKKFKGYQMHKRLDVVEKMRKKLQQRLQMQQYCWACGGPDAAIEGVDVKCSKCHIVCLDQRTRDLYATCLQVDKSIIDGAAWELISAVVYGPLVARIEERLIPRTRAEKCISLLHKMQAAITLLDQIYEAALETGEHSQCFCLYFQGHLMRFL